VPFVADPQQPSPAPAQGGSFVPDAGQQPPASQPQSSLRDTAATWGSAAIRPVVKAAIYASTFIPDFATSLTNAIANAGEKALGIPHGEDAPMPSSYFLNKLDQYTRQPTTAGERFAEEASSILIGGGEALGKAGANLLEDAGKAAMKLVGHSTGGGLTRVTSQAAEQAHNAGFILSPDYVGGKVAKAVQQAAGGGKVNARFSELNQSVADRLAKTSLGLHPGEELDDYTFQTLRKAENVKYDKMASIGNLPDDPLYVAQVNRSGGRFAQRSQAFGGGYRYDSVADEKALYQGSSSNPVTAQEAIDEIRALRKTSRDNLKNYDPERNALGSVQREIADALDARLERRAAQLAKQGVIPSDVYQGYKEARQNLARIATVEDAVGPGGHIISGALAAAKEKGVKLSGGLDIIADTYKNFSRDMKFTGKSGEQGVWAPLDFLVGGAGVIAHNPKAATAFLARPLARATLGSKPVQSAMIKGSPKLGKVTKRVVKGSVVRGSEAAQESDEDSE
jgi:hypothetical protein